MGEAAYASIPPAVAPAIKEWSGFSLFDVMVVDWSGNGLDARDLGVPDFPGESVQRPHRFISPLDDQTVLGTGTGTGGNASQTCTTQTS